MEYLPTIRLNQGMEIPAIGFGTYKVTQNDAHIIEMAIECGYRMFDAASYYETEPYLAEAIAQSGIDRSALTLISKVWKTEMGYEETLAACERSLCRLRTDYLDLYLIHWPRPDLHNEHWQTLVLDTWRAMEHLYQQGKVRAIGLSNFLPHHIKVILDHCTIQPMVNQLEFHPGYLQLAAVSYCQKNKIQVQAWSPLGRTRVLQDPLIVSLAEQYGVSPAQICLRFAIQNNVIPLPKASSLVRMKENLNLDFELSELDLLRIATMPCVGWSGEHPDRERQIMEERKQPQ